ncbi:MAG: stage II sporulation protein R [Christensenellales bacterium]
MKYFKFVIICLFFIVFVVGCVYINQDNQTSLKNADYLRLHIRANSNDECDQNVKYVVKNKVLNLITKDISSIDNKEDLAQYFVDNKQPLQNFVDAILKENGFDYISTITVKNEYFPSRTYQDVTLVSGYYDAIIIELGNAQGNNWWCVAYPPLCFMYESSQMGNITYRSKIVELINKFFKR